METAAAPLMSAVPPPVVSRESIDSLPPDAWEADPKPAPQKLRLMCSYGGHIVPRPHDKTLFYGGGDTRMIVIDRHASLSELHHRLSKTLLNNQPFTLKYQLPNEDLDSLISVSTDEDLENMVEECDRLSNAAAAKHGRIRLFLFPKSPSSIEQLLVESGSGKTEDWFFNALNGKIGSLSGGASERDFSESSSINNLLGLDDEPAAKPEIGGKDGDSKIGRNRGSANQDVHSIPDSPMLDTTSSFGSNSSSPFMVNLPPIKVHVEENPKVSGAVLGTEDQFRQIKVAGVGNPNLIPPQKQEESRVFVMPVVPGAVPAGLPVVVGGEYPTNRAFSDDERFSDHGGRIKVQPQGQAQLPVPQVHPKPVGATDLPSPDSASSEGSARTSRVDKIGEPPNSMKFQGQPPQVQEHGYILSGGQYDQNHPPLHHHPQQFVHPGNPYFPAGAVPIASYYPVYDPQQQHHPHQPMLDQQQYPFYFVPARPAQAYNLQSPSTHLEMPRSKPEVPSKVSRQTSGPNPQLMQVPLGFNQIPLPSQSINPKTAAGNAPFVYEFADPAHPQLYYTQPLPPQMTTHYQIPNTSAQLLQHHNRDET